ncbi:MAG TPA: hypothetical protein VEH31_10025 [Streptosporangiaceae bacterium]|nr:hypothetical protein [Streptosporangiaceae bacterium]
MSSTGDILAGSETLRAGQEAPLQGPAPAPELSHAEHRTARRAAGQPQDAGFTIASGTGGTGVAGVPANGSGPAVLLRCATAGARPLTAETEQIGSRSAPAMCGVSSGDGPGLGALWPAVSGARVISRPATW